MKDLEIEIKDKLNLLKEDESTKEFAKKWEDHLEGVCFCCNDNLANGIKEQIEEGLLKLK